MAKLRDKLWLWAQSPDAHYETNNTYNLPGHSRMTAAEGAFYFNIPNVCRVRMMGHPMPPYDQESVPLRPCKQVVWSLLGAGAEPVTEWGDTDEVIKQAKMYDNVVGGVFDDFFLQKRIEFYTPDKLRAIKKRMCDGVGRNLDMWVVIYEDKLDNVANIADYLDAFDVLTFWTWEGKSLNRAEANIDRIHKLAPGKSVKMGLYMWNYGEHCPFTVEDMKAQCENDLRMLKDGKIDGIILCSNCIADLNIEAVEWTRNWLFEHMDDEI